MPIIANIRGPQGFVAVLVLTWVNPTFTISQANPSISVNVSTRVVTFLVAGYYLTDWTSPAVHQAANSTVTLSKMNHQIAGPLT